jgi:hypothetical protein
MTRPSSMDLHERVAAAVKGGQHAQQLLRLFRLRYTCCGADRGLSALVSSERSAGFSPPSQQAHPTAAPCPSAAISGHHQSRMVG